MPLPWQYTFCHCQKKHVSCTSTPQGKHLCQISWELVKNWGSSSRRKISPHFCHNMPLPWQHSFCHCRKMCLAHLHPKAHICAKFHENWSKTEEVVRDARLAPDRRPARPTDRPTTRWFLYTPLYTTCMRGYNQEMWPADLTPETNEMQLLEHTPECEPKYDLWPYKRRNTGGSLSKTYRCVDLTMKHICTKFERNTSRTVACRARTTFPPKYDLWPYKRRKTGGSITKNNRRVDFTKIHLHTKFERNPSRNAAVRAHTRMWRGGGVTLLNSKVSCRGYNYILHTKILATGLVKMQSHDKL